MIISGKGVANAVQAAGRAVGAAVAGEGIIVDLSVREARRSQCAACPRLSADGKQCLECECLINLKTMMATEKCPLQRWAQ